MGWPTDQTHGTMNGERTGIVTTTKLYMAYIVCSTLNQLVLIAKDALCYKKTRRLFCFRKRLYMISHTAIGIFFRMTITHESKWKAPIE